MTAGRSSGDDRVAGPKDLMKALREHLDAVLPEIREQRYNATEDYPNWTSCEMYGHNSLDGYCSDCGEDLS